MQQKKKDWVRLTTGQRRALRHRLRRAKTAPERRRLNVVALYDAGQKMETIARLLGCSLGTVSLDLERWHTEGFRGFAPKPCGGSKPKVSEEQFAVLERVLEIPPSQAGYHAGTWTLPLMVRFLVEKVGAPTLHIGNVSRRLHKKKWARVRPRLEILREDPEREAKLAAIEAEKRGRWQPIRRP